MSEPTYTLYCGDCLDYMRGMDAGSVDAVITDPPYGIGFAAMPTKWQRLAGKTPVDWDNDIVDVSGLIDFAKVVIIWGGNYYSLPPSRCWLSWFKPDAPPSMSNIELAWTNQDALCRQFQYSISAGNRERVGFPTQKPLAVMRWCIELFTKRGDTIFDPFMGSGTTGVACMQLGRNFIGCEIDPAYYAIAERRIKDAAAQPPLFTLNASAPKYEQGALMEL